MRTNDNRKILILKNQQGKPCRLLQTNNNRVSLIKNADTKRIELLNTAQVDEDRHKIILTFDLSKISTSMGIQGVGSLSVHKFGEQLPLDTPSILKEEDHIEAVTKWSAGAHATVAILFILIAQFFPYKKINIDKDKQLTVINIQTPENQPESPKPKEPSAPKSERRKEHVQVAQSKKNIHVKPRANKNKSLKVTRSSSRPVQSSAPKDFRQLGTLSALSGAIKGSRHGSGSGLHLAGGAIGGTGRGAGTGIGNGTNGSGYSGSGGGYAQSLGGKGLIAGQVGGGGGGLGSGWGNGTRGNGGSGTKGRGGGHEGYGNSRVGGGVAEFVFPNADDALVEGGLDREAVNLVISRNIGQISACYELGLQQKSGLRGRVSVFFVINGSGRVSQARVQNTSLKSNLVENCMVGKIKNWRFPHPVGGVNVDVTYPFSLQRLSQN